jgi:hypothetical protein
MVSSAPSELRLRLAHELGRQLGEPVELVSIREENACMLRGVAVCSGRVLSFVLHAEEQRLRTRPLFDLLRHSRLA